MTHFLVVLLLAQDPVVWRPAIVVKERSRQQHQTDIGAFDEQAREIADQATGALAVAADEVGRRSNRVFVVDREGVWRALLAAAEFFVTGLKASRTLRRVARPARCGSPVRGIGHLAFPLVVFGFPVGSIGWRQIPCQNPGGRICPWRRKDLLFPIRADLLPLVMIAPTLYKI